MIYVVLILVLSFAYIFYSIGRKPKIPQGLKEIPIEKGLPIIGILHKIQSPFPLYLKQLANKHGSMFRIMLGMRDVLIINDFNILKRTFLENGSKFSGRWLNQANKIRYHDSGVLFKDGEVWSKQRGFILRVLRDFGLGRSRSLEIVESECLILLEELEKLNNKKVDFSQIIPIYTANIISRFIMNKRFEREDPKIKFIGDVVTEVTKTKDMAEFFHLILPISDHISFFANMLMKFSRAWKRIYSVHMLFKQEIDEHKERLNQNAEGEDLIDRLLIEQQKLKEKTGSVETFTEWQLIINVTELYAAGYETTSTTLGWSMMFMARYPDIQKRVYNEIVDKIGTERLPTMNDKKSLNYTQAVIDEIFRLSSVVPLAIFHRTLEDTSIDEYFIPKNTVIIPNLFACHTDPKIWKKPNEFYPEHFLLSKEIGEEKYNCREELIPFGIGKRQCLGESLARMEYLIFFMSIIQRFEVKFAEEIDNDLFNKTLVGNEGIIRFCKIRDFVFRKRF